jgi:LCP family protein required for cell wall assembly
MPRRHHRVRWTILSIVGLVIIALVASGWIAYRAISVLNTKKADGTKVSFFQQLAHIVTSNNDQLNGEADDQVNILLLGYGGPGHDGPYLTDTMMVASYKPSTKQLALISIPRDLVVDIPGYDYRKINSVLSFGRDRNYPGGGEALTVKVVGDLLNIPIQYYARIDFTGFKDVIDLLGGVDVTVDTAFSDGRYPDSGIGYEPISFKAGPQTMNGDRALKFARSRHGNNGEGSDIARAKRQQKIIEAMKEKLLSFGTLSNPKKITDIITSLGTHSQTNMEVWEILRLAKLAGNLTSDHIINKVYDDSPDGFLRAATGTGGAFIFVPRDGDYTDMQFYARNIFQAVATETEKANIAVVNATSYPTLGSVTSRGLSAFGLSVLKTTSLSKLTVGQTVLVSTHPGQYPNTERLLNSYAHAVGTLSLADWQAQTGDTTLATLLGTPITITSTSTIITNGRAVNTNTSSTIMPDLILVLGQDQPNPTAPILTNTSSTNTNSAVTNTNTKTTNTNTKTTNTNTITTNRSTNTNTPTTNTNQGLTNSTNTNQ